MSLAIIFAIRGEGVRADEAKKPAPPDGKTIDLLNLSISSSPLGGLAHLAISKTGQLSYTHQTAPFTGSGGIVTTKSWEMAPADAAALLRGVIEDGLLDLPDDEKAAFAPYQVSASYGRWQVTMRLKERPEKLLKRVMPLLQQAHPEMWGQASQQ